MAGRHWASQRLVDLASNGFGEVLQDWSCWMFKQAESREQHTSLKLRVSGSTKWAPEREVAV